LWVIVQNVGQLKQHYKDAWQTFFANCGVVTALSVTDAETLETLSNQLGRTAIVEKVRSGASDSALRQGASPLQDDRREVPLLAAHELRLAFGRDKNRVLIFNAEYNPAVGAILPRQRRRRPPRSWAVSPARLRGKPGISESERWLGF
jgi:type IV secretion system protein VirD4